MNTTLSDSRWNGVGGICTFLMLVLYIVVERDKLASPAKVIASGLLKYFLAMLPTLAFFSALVIYAISQGSYNQVTISTTITSVILLSLPVLPVILVTTAKQSYSKLKIAWIGSVLGACGGIILVLVIELFGKPAWNMAWNIVLTAIAVEAVLGYYTGITTYFVNRLFLKEKATTGKKAAKTTVRKKKAA